ncbi:hypothetical protein D3C85_1729190 [compost metagenome]
MHDAIGQHQVDVDLRVVRQKFRHHWHHVQAPEHDRGGDHQFAFRAGVFTRRCAFGFANVFENASAGRHVGVAGFG